MQKPLLCAFLLAALCACKKDENPNAPQEDKATLEVQVYNTLNWSTSQPYGTLAAGATVQLFKTKESFTSNAPVYTQTTDVSGKATFTKIDTGLYYIVAKQSDISNLLGATLKDGVYIGYSADSLYQTPAEVAAGPLSSQAAPGNFRLSDLNFDGIIDANDKTLLPAQSATVKASTTSAKRILIGRVDNRTNTNFADEAAVNAAQQTAVASLNKWHELQVSIDAVYTDDKDCTGLGGDWCTINGYTGFTAANTTITGFWNGAFQLISQLNRIILYAGKVTDPNMTATEKTLAVARARGMKGYVYLQLISYFGGVPLQDSLSLRPNASRVTVAEAYTYTEDLLLQAGSGLGTDVAVIPAAACHALLAKLYIQQQRYNEVFTYCNMVLNNTAYALVDTTAIFTQTGNKEILWKTADTLEAPPLRTIFTRGQFLPEIRLAEVLFMQTEAYIEWNDMQKAVASFNKLRQRENRSLFTYSDAPAFRESLRGELYTNYTRHMRLEGLRLPLLRRWGRQLAVLGPLGFKEYNGLLPIPLAVQTQYPNIQQNVGY